MFIFATYNATFCHILAIIKQHVTRNKENYYKNSKYIS